MLATAVAFGLEFAIATAVVSMVAFNFFFLPPVHTLSLAHAEDWTALAVYLVTGVVASQLASRARRRAVEAEQRERETALLADAAAVLLREAPLDEIRGRATRVLASADPSSRARFEAAMVTLDALAAERHDVESVRQSDALKTVILQTVSHDFRTPLATITAAVGGLEELDLDEPDRRELLETIRLEGARLSRLVENVLDLSRLQTGAAAARSALWAVDDLVAEAVADVTDAARVRIRVPEGLPPVVVDAVQIQRTLVNLLENALKFSAEDVDVVARPDDDRVVIEVDDRGPGLSAGATAARGLGLGLEIAHGFARLNGATLELAPRPGGGTRASLKVRVS